MAGRFLSVLASCTALSVDAVGLRQQRLARDAFPSWWTESWVGHLLRSVRNKYASHLDNRIWWNVNWTQSRQDGDVWEETPYPRAPRFYMDQHLWASWRKKCPDTSKHTTDRDLLYSLENHTWRIRNPEDADVIVLPVLMSDSVQGLCGDHKENMLELAGFLEKSPEWRRFWGKDHLVSGFEWEVPGGQIREMKPYLRNMTVVEQDRDKEERWVFDGQWDTFRYDNVLIAPYLSAFADHAGSGFVSFQAWAARPYSIIFVGQTLAMSPSFTELGFAYHGYELRKAALKSLGDTFQDAFLVCASRSRCAEPIPPDCDADFKPVGCRYMGRLPDYEERLKQARFGLYTRGDTSSSGHLYDIIDALAIPIIVDDGFFHKGAPFSSVIDWPKVALFIPEAAFLADPATAVLDAINIPKEDMEDRLQRVSRAQNCLSWRRNATRVASVLVADFASRAAAKSSARNFLTHNGELCSM